MEAFSRFPIKGFIKKPFLGKLYSLKSRSACLHLCEAKMFFFLCCQSFRVICFLIHLEAQILKIIYPSVENEHDGTQITP